jgi:hypothetical protein
MATHRADISVPTTSRPTNSRPSSSIVFLGVTERYAEFDPQYFNASVSAIEEF